MSAPVPAPPPPPRGPWQRLYAAVLARRRTRWARRARRLPRPALSVGNLHWGGGGKTPLVAAVCETLRDSGRRVGVLSRGYGRRGSEPRVVSQGDGPLVPPALAGDEPYLLAERLTGVAVAVCGDRLAAARALLSRAAVDWFVLDDAFSHVRVARDVELLAFPLHDPWGGGRLLPSGRLREPLAAARGADAAVLTGLPRADREAAAELERGLLSHGFTGEVFASALAAALAAPRDQPAARRFVLVSGTADPGSVRATAERLGLDIAAHLVFPDHHPYPRRSLREIRRAAADAGAAVLTTTKDRVKLAGGLGLPLWEIEVSARPEPRFTDWLGERIAGVEATARRVSPRDGDGR